MAHLLLLEAPGGNDLTLIEDAIHLGHQVTFATGDLAQYTALGETVRAALALASDIVEIRPFAQETLEREVLKIHAVHPFDAILCLLDIRMVAASRLAARLGLRFLNPETTRMARDKVSIRAALARHGIRQPAFALAETTEDVRRAVRGIGFPVLVKPADGYGSQNVHVLFSDSGTESFIRAMETARPAHYGFGVRANQRLSVEQYIRGSLIGCDVFTSHSERVMLGINDKAMFPPPSFAMRGSCFPSARYDSAAIRAYAFQILDAIGFDFGAAHIELIVAEDGPYLVEVNPRLVGAQIPYQMGYALQRSIYADLVNLHLGHDLAELRSLVPAWFSAIRWITADHPGVLDGISLPNDPAPEIRRVVLFKSPGEPVQPPINNGDRIGYVIAVGSDQGTAERIAERYVRDSRVTLR